MIRSAVFTSIFLLLLPPPLWGQDQGDTATTSIKAPSRAAIAVERTHTALSNRVLTVSDRIDSIFGHDEYETEKPGTHVRLKFLSTTSKNEDTQFKTQVNSKLVLPRTQKKLHLVIDNLKDRHRDDSIITADDLATSPPSEGVPSSSDDSYGTALRYIPHFTKKLRAHLDSGVRFVNPLDPFVRAKASQLTSIKSWSLRFDQHAQWYKSDGTAYDVGINFDRPVSLYLHLRQSNIASWSQQNQYYSFQNGLSLFHRLPRDRGLTYFVSATGTSEPITHATDYSVGVSFRVPVNTWKWLIFQLTPMVSYPQEFRFVANPSVTVQLETTIGAI